MRLIDADALILAIATAGQDNKGGRYIVGDIWELNFQEIREVINNAPTVDAVPVVRCGDCKWWKCADDTEIIRYGDCTYPWSAIRKNCLPNETWYCADGERRKK